MGALPLLLLYAALMASPAAASLHWARRRDPPVMLPDAATSDGMPLAAGPSVVMQLLDNRPLHWPLHSAVALRRTDEGPNPLALRPGWFYPVSLVALPEAAIRICRSFLDGPQHTALGAFKGHRASLRCTALAGWAAFGSLSKYPDCPSAVHVGPGDAGRRLSVVAGTEPDR